MLMLQQAWNDVPLTLETATPTFGINIPALSPWTLSVSKPMVMASKSRGYKAKSIIRERSATNFEESDDDMGFGLFDGEPTWHSSMTASSKGISATYRVPGLINIPSDNASHSVTIVQLKLDSTMSWVAVPKVDLKMHLKVSYDSCCRYQF